MKYIATLFANDTEYTVAFSIRSDARLNTVFTKAINETCDYMRKKGLASGAIPYHVEMPNIWTNGGIGTIIIKDYFVCLESENGCVLAN